MAGAEKESHYKNVESSILEALGGAGILVFTTLRPVIRELNGVIGYYSKQKLSEVAGVTGEALKRMKGAGRRKAKFA